MKFIISQKEKYTIISAMCFSLLIHFAAGALLVFGLSNNLISPSKLNGLDLVWVSLDAKSKSSGIEIKNGHAEQPSSALERIAENPADKPETTQINVAAIKALANTITLAKYDASCTGTGEQSDSINDYGKNKNADKISNLNTVIAYPLYKENAPPAYPEIARVRGYEGIVLVFAEVLPNGRVGEVKIRKSSGYAILDQSAIQAVKPWKFEPAKKSGNPFTAWVELPIRFILHNNTQS